LSRVHINQESCLNRDRLRLGQARPCSPATHYRRSPIRVAQWHYPQPGQMENNDRTLKELDTPDMAFPFSLDGAAKDWLYLQPALFNTWGDMKRTLEKFFSASRTVTTRKEICGIRQHTGETLHE
ncbi:hypothetical protein CR513_40027, partial [Mucuna pruriens]